MKNLLAVLAGIAVTVVVIAFYEPADSAVQLPTGIFLVASTWALILAIIFDSK